MTRTFTCIATVAMAAFANTSAFVPTGSRKRSFLAMKSAASQIRPFDDNLFFIEKEGPHLGEAPTPTKKMPKAKAHKDGPLSPVVLLAKIALGEKQLNKIRADVISMHSDVIGNFVETADSAIGQAVLKTLFDASDSDKNAAIDEVELAKALHTLGFDWLKDKQIKGILKRADTNENGVIDFEEWMKEAPKTLRTNLVKLAKKNGGNLGLLV